MVGGAKEELRLFYVVPLIKISLVPYRKDVTVWSARKDNTVIAI